MSMLAEMKSYWLAEILGGSDEKFSWYRLRKKCKRSNRSAYLFWYRLAYVLHSRGNAFWRRRAKSLNERISRRYNVEIMMGAVVGEGLWIAHPSGIVVSAYAVIGKNFKIWQNCTIGIKGKSGNKKICIGDNVKLCAHSCIIGDHVEIVSGVTIGAMSFVNTSLRSPGVYVTKKNSQLIVAAA
ncbi:serine acetyltransferase [Stutzerimonas chloritidismutans]|uniref:serine acetyltransferase n=1 Tax=Stutzerimonas chloritidismutans TaxID=203192 RepID=UPI003850111C